MNRFKISCQYKESICRLIRLIVVLLSACIKTKATIAGHVRTHVWHPKERKVFNSAATSRNTCNLLPTKLETHSPIIDSSTKLGLMSAI